MYPNPVKQVVNFDLIYHNGDYKIYDNMGILIKKGILKNKSINLEMLSGGIYFIEINYTTEEKGTNKVYTSILVKE